MVQRIGAFIHSDQIESLHYPPECPWKTGRAGKTRSVLRSMGLYNCDGSSEVSPRPATVKELLLFHEPRYIDALRRISRGDFHPDDLSLGLGMPDTPVFADLFPYAELAAGGTITGAEIILHGNVDYAFNPSGGFHHAMPSTAGGFCYINDIALACKILTKHGKRVFCLDLDASHGNGTQTAFYADPSVFNVSFHENPDSLYPFSGFVHETGEGEGFGYNVNVPLPAGTDDDAFIAAFTAIVPPLLDAYEPDVILLDIGMNVLASDQSTHLRMTNNAIADTLPQLIRSGVPMLVVGGGGTSLEHTARGWALAWSILAGAAESGSGLRDTKIYSPGDRKKEISRQIDKTVSVIQHTVFPIHGI
jgi:acetoin utilization protein AcuC